MKQNLAISFLIGLCILQFVERQFVARQQKQFRQELEVSIKQTKKALTLCGELADLLRKRQARINEAVNQIEALSKMLHAGELVSGSIPTNYIVRPSTIPTVWVTNLWK